ncbi:MAG: PCP reductase family protein [Synechococcus sp.]|nr:PCP reductase family protein [Synechococcus sp.]
MDWSAEAELALKEVPFFVRPAVRKRIETMAKDAGLTSINADFYAAARAQFGSK